MKMITNVARVLVGCLFIFSGLVKAIDPRGLAYKMEEFFEAWANSGFMPGLMHSLSGSSLTFSMIMITLEVVLGAALLLGWQKKIVSWLLFLLTLFFTFLTAYVLFSGKIRACGCFGDCIPLTPVQTFTKDIVLTVLGIIILLNLRHIKSLFSDKLSMIILLVLTALVLWLQFSALKNLPVVDCLPYKKGNNIVEEMKMPANAVADKYDYKFVYEKNGEKKEFDVSALPDSTWSFVDRKQVLVEKGSNNIPNINDFALIKESGENITDSVLNSGAEYALLFIKDEPSSTGWIADYNRHKEQYKHKVYLVTANPKSVRDFTTKKGVKFDELLTCDGVAIKTAARANPTLYHMKGGIVLGKWGWGKFSNLP